VSDQHAQFEHTLAAYLLGALPQDEAAEFERHLEGCERCREEAASLRAAVDVLPVAVPPVTPPPRIKERVMAVVESEADLLHAAGSEADRPERRAKPRRGLRRWFPRPVITAGAAAAALAVGVIAGVAIVGGHDDGSSQRTLAAQVSGPAAATARASVIVDGSQAKLRVTGMPSPRPGRIYQVWLKRPGTPAEPAGTFMLHSGDVRIPQAVHDGDRVMVTSEPDPGSRRPTSAPTIVAQPV
jgi:anti-sigma factor RsiW